MEQSQKQIFQKQKARNGNIEQFFACRYPTCTPLQVAIDLKNMCTLNDVYIYLSRRKRLTDHYRELLLTSYFEAAAQCRGEKETDRHTVSELCDIKDKPFVYICDICHEKTSYSCLCALKCDPWLEHTCMTADCLLKYLLEYSRAITRLGNEEQYQENLGELMEKQGLLEMYVNSCEYMRLNAQHFDRPKLMPLVNAMGDQVSTATLIDSFKFSWEQPILAQQLFHQTETDESIEVVEETEAEAEEEKKAGESDDEEIEYAEDCHSF